MYKIGLTQKEKQSLCEKYESGIKVPQLCKEFGRCVYTIYDVLRKNNIKTHRRISGRNINNFSEKEINHIILLYASGLNSAIVGNEFGISHTLVLKIIEKYSDLDHSRVFRIRKYKDTKQDYFDNIDTEEKAYFLGLLFADGCNSTVGISIGLQEKDKHIIEKWRDAVSPSQPIVFIKKRELSHQNQYGIAIYSKSLCKQAALIGLIPRKSLILEWPQWLTDPELQRHFIRDYFDGDGSLTVGNNIDYQHQWSVVSTLDFCIGVDKIINSHLDVHFWYELHANGITRKLATGGNRQVLRLCNWLYRDATVYLHRKYDRYQELVR